MKNIRQLIALILIFLIGINFSISQDITPKERFSVAATAGYQDMGMASVNKYLAAYSGFGNNIHPFSKINGGPCYSLVLGYFIGENRRFFTSLQLDYFQAKSTATFNTNPGIPDVWHLEYIFAAFDITASGGYKWRFTDKISLSAQGGISYILAYMGDRNYQSDDSESDYYGLLHDDIGFLVQLNPEYQVLNWFSIYSILGYRRAMIKPVLNVAGNPYRENIFGYGENEKELEIDFSGITMGIGVRFIINSKK